MIRSRTLALCALALAVGGCSTLQSWIPSIPSIPAPSLSWLFGKSSKPGPLPALNARTTPQLNWQVSVGKATPGLAPAITASGIRAKTEFVSHGNAISTPRIARSFFSKPFCMSRFRQV